ncbi:MAG TPA: glycerophosphodiester phosphodiesterase family protein [Steroidobacter sp.]|uniref:glycerophosphodiester phosphodiesterase family protein n=1 Tax=Steroidobacter sp. TaxID=1978227 RepID=UPI002ED99BB0
MSASRLSPPLPDLIAQRGNSGEYPENTLPALRSALELGARHVAFDVQLTADRQPVLLNDSNLKRMAGLDRSALEMAWHQLAEISVTEPDRFQRQFNDIGVPTLAQAAMLMGTHPSVTAFIEIKRASLRVFGTDVVVRKVCEVLKPIVRQCVLVSRDLTAVHHVRQVSSCRIGWILSEYSNLSALKSEALVPDYLLCDHELLTPTNAQLWRGPWRWVIQNVSSRETAAQLAARGAKLVATTSFRKLLRELKAGAERA